MKPIKKLPTKSPTVTINLTFGQVIGLMVITVLLGGLFTGGVFMALLSSKPVVLATPTLTPRPKPTLPPAPPTAVKIPDDIKKIIEYDEKHRDEAKVITHENGVRIIIYPTPDFPTYNALGTPFSYSGEIRVITDDTAPREFATVRP